MRKYTGLRITGVAILAWLLYRVDLRHIYGILMGSRVTLIWAALAAMMLHVLIKFVRYQYILTQQHVDSPFRKTVQFSMAAIYLSFITPGRVGEVGKAFFIHRDRGASLKKLLAGSILDRLYDVYLLIFTTLAGIIFLITPLGSGALPLSLSLMAIALAPLVLLIPGIRSALLSIVCWVPRKIRKSDALFHQLNDFLQEIDVLLNWKLGWGLLLTIIAYMLFFYSCSLMSLSVGVFLPYHKIAFFVACVNIASFLPISFAGIGTREACLVYLFAREGLSSESALAFSTVMFLLTYVFFGVFGFACLMTLKQEKAPSAVGGS